jgi:hypothetical protein
MFKILEWIFDTYEHKVRTILMSQADINTQVQNIQAVTADLVEILTNLQADLSGQDVDTTALDAAVEALQAADANLKAAVPVPSSDTVTVTNPGSLTSSISGGAVSRQMVAMDSDVAETLAFSATDLPTGLTMSDTGLVTGTPSVEGSNTVTVTATDSTGASGSASFSWTITA